MPGYAQEMKTVGEPDEIRVPREDEETIEPAPNYEPAPAPDPAPTEPEPVPSR
jgi:hypothetical protein